MLQHHAAECKYWDKSIVYFFGLKLLSIKTDKVELQNNLVKDWHRMHTFSFNRSVEGNKILLNSVFF